MHADKAREYFSAYYEGTLDASLRSVLERELAQDAALQAEYRAFVKAIESLKAMRDVPIEVPADLNERIAARLDRHIWEEKQTAKPGLFAWWKALALGGAVAASLFAVVTTMNRPSGASTADLTGTLSRAATIEVSFTNGQLNLLTPAGRNKVEVRDGLNGPVLDSIEADPSQVQKSPLRNIGDRAKIIVIQSNAKDEAIILAVPGQRSDREANGEGNLEKFALSVADFYRQPVQIRTSDLGWTGTWTLKGTEVSEIQITSTGTLTLRAEMLRNGLIRLGR